MIAQLRSLRTWRRGSAALVTLALASLAVGASPLATGTAHADGGTATSLLSISPSEPQAADGPMDLVYLSEGAGLFVTDKAPRHVWSLVPNTDGSFTIRVEGIGECVDVDNDDYLTRSSCDTSNGKQNWYLQGNGSDGYRIRNVTNNKCMDVRESLAQNIGKVGIFDCGQGKKNQIWHLSPAQPGGTGPTVADLATEYALKQCSKSSSIVPSCDYEITGDAKATVGDLKRVSDKAFNYTTLPKTRAVAWSQTTSQTDTVGGSITITAEQGFDVKAVQVKVSQAITAHYSHSWTQFETVSDTNTITVNPGQYSWAMRGQLMKTVFGKWKFTNDLGEKWSGEGAATVPATKGTDDGESSLVFCSSDSTEPVCVNTRW
ncbi:MULTISPECIES: RICIN domain-containing protein [Streptomyces]|uniref:RICIN domain-containing protein n=1 Tax=Streptomyces TaxID=1883 RepID=UPI000A05BE2F|nr:RICIN domain-containing protein [Streptomyces sp. MOE7]